LASSKNFGGSRQIYCGRRNKKGKKEKLRGQESDEGF